MADPVSAKFAPSLAESAAVPATPRFGFEAKGRPEARWRKPSRILILAVRFKLPYRVMRCAAAAGCEVFVLGAHSARKLAYSRYCSAFFETSRALSGDLDLGLHGEINALSAQHGIDMVLPGDAPTTRALIQLRPLIRPPCFPSPDLEQFDLLNDKWRFGQLCEALAIECPPSRLFPTLADLRRALRENPSQTRLIAKPLSRDSGEGCVILEPGAGEAGISKIDYAPILVQNFIEGEDIGASVFCRRGEILNFIAHRFQRDTYFSFYEEAIFLDLKKVVGSLGCDGVFNFDMRRTVEGRVFYLECNPRFYFKIAMSMIAGVNMVAAGLDDAHRRTAVLADCKTVRFPKAFLAAAARFRRLEAESWVASRFVLGDPAPYLLEALRWQE